VPIVTRSRSRETGPSAERDDLPRSHECAEQQYGRIVERRGVDDARPIRRVDATFVEPA
jgi:hypothetical protein